MSACRLIVPKIGDKKGKQTKSILYANILDTVKNDTKKATKLYKLIYSSDFRNRFGDWISKPQGIIAKLDSNGEPKLKEFSEYVSSLNLAKEPNTDSGKANDTETTSLTIDDIFEKYFNLNPEELKGEDPVDPTDNEDELAQKLMLGITGYQKILVDRKNFLTASNENKRAKFKFQDKTINGIEALLAELGSDVENLSLNYSKGELIRIFSKVLDSIQNETDKISKYINNKNNVSTDAYISVVLEAQRMLQAYDNLRLGVDLGMTNTNTENKMVRTIDSLNVLKDDLVDAVNSYVTHIVQTTTNNKSLTEEDIKNILKESYDIPLEDYLFGDTATSMDTLLAIADIQYKNAILEVSDRHDTHQETIRELGNHLLKATGTNNPKGAFNFMIDFDSNGKMTGRLLQKIGKTYYDIKKKFKDPLFNDDGEKKEYYELENLSTASKEQIAHNIALAKIKAEYNEFNRAEFNENSKLFDGEYHKYTDEFKQERDKYEFWDETTSSWYVKPQFENSKEYIQYKNKYYTDPRETLVAVKTWDNATKSYKHQGKTEWKSMSFVKSDYIVIKDKSTGGTDLRDPRWVKLQTPTNEKERAQLDFYNKYIDLYNQLLSKLPEKYRKEMSGKFIKVKLGLFNNLMENKESMLKVLARSFRQWGKPAEYSAQRVTDENGLVSDEVPLFYSGEFQSQKRVDSLNNEIAKLKEDYKNSRISQEDYTNKRKELTSKLNFELGKVRADEASTDLLQGLTMFSRMAENYDVMSNLEDMFKSIATALKNRKVKRKDFRGKDLYTTDERGNKTPVYKSGMDSLAYKRFSKWMKMVFYENEDIDNSTAATVAKRAQTVTSLSKIGLNVFGGINNYVMGRINNTIEAAGGQFYGLKQLRRATSEYNKQLLPGVFEKIGKLSKSKDPYRDAKPHSKFEAVVEMFHIVREQASGQGNPHSKITDWVYMFQKGGEYNVQSKPGVALLMKETIKSDTGEESTVYDALQFDKATGRLSFKPGYSLSTQDRNKLINKIWEINKVVHGNWEAIDRMVIQQHWLGQLGAQFHKWIYPSYKARFKKRYYDENLGSIEGRYLTMASFFKYANQLSWNFKKAYQSLNENQKANMRKNLMELSLLMASYAMWGVFKALAAGIPDEDENLKKFVNFLQSQEDRQTQEIRTLIPIAGTDQQWQMITNPLAAANTVKDFGQAVWETMKIPYNYMEDSMYYERGPFQDDLKFMKEWRDVLPGLYSLNKWDSFETVKNFYIK